MTFQRIPSGRVLSGEAVLQHERGNPVIDERLGNVIALMHYPKISVPPSWRDYYSHARVYFMGRQKYHERGVVNIRDCFVYNNLDLISLILKTRGPVVP